jgi:predicted glycogen debranching enzyme
MIKLDTSICSRFERASSREWLETNGIGGYASSSISGANTRRYHGLLVAATKPPLGRLVMLSKFEETVRIDGEMYELSCNQYSGKIHPEGYKLLAKFRLDPFPVWTFNVAGIEIEKKLFMAHGDNSTVVSWLVKDRKTAESKQIELELKPLLAFRDHHHLRRENTEFRRDYATTENMVSIAPYDAMPRLYLANNAISIEPRGHWYRNFEYAIERERGFDFTEDLFQPFSMRFDLADDAVVIASTEAKQINDAATLEAAEVSRRTELVREAGVTDEFEKQLVLAADQFIVSRGTGKTVIAGYPWFSDWGRDTMIALNGLTLATGRYEIAKSILTEFSKYISEGMLPNRFPDAGEIPEYNTVDATLWFFEAVRAYAQQTEDYAFVETRLYDKLADIIDWHVRGTRYGIHVDTDGLVYAGREGVQLTWMDAKIGEWVVTPRTGKPVEIQALGYNALCTMADLAAKFSKPRDQARYLEMAAKAKVSFNKLFWNNEQECLFDVINDGSADASVRPNQILAASLPHTMLSPKKAHKVVDKVEAVLLTPFGVRSLSPKDSRYIPVYSGSPFDRDAAYHQGTVWAWLIGGYIDAYRKVHSKDPIALARVREIIAGFKTHLTESMIGQVSEIFDGDAPHAARGCGAQAWSVGELLRVIRSA